MAKRAQSEKWASRNIIKTLRLDSFEEHRPKGGTGQSGESFSSRSALAHIAQQSGEPSATNNLQANITHMHYNQVCASHAHNMVGDRRAREKASLAQKAKRYLFINKRKMIMMIILP